MFTEQERQIIDYGKANGRTLDQVKQSISNYRLGISKEPVGPSFGGRLKEAAGDIMDIGGDIKEVVLNRGDKAREIIDAQGSGEQGAASSVFQHATNFASSVTDVVGAGIKGVVKLTLSQEKEQKVKDSIAKFGQKVIEMPEVQQFIQNYEDLKKEDPELARNVVATAELGQYLLSFAGLKAAEKTGQVLKAGVKSTVKGVGEVAKQADDAVRAGGKAISSKADDLLKSADDFIPDDIARIPSRLVTNIKGKQAANAAIKALPSKTAQNAVKDGIKQVDVEDILRITANKANKPVAAKLVKAVKEYSKGGKIDPIEVVGNPIVKGMKQLSTEADDFGKGLHEAAKELGNVTRKEIAPKVFAELRKVPGLEGLKVNAKGVLDFSDTVMLDAGQKANRAALQRVFAEAVAKGTGRSKHLLRQSLFKQLRGAQRSLQNLTDTDEKAIQAIRKGLSNVLEAKSEGYKALNQGFAQRVGPLNKLQDLLKVGKETDDDILNMSAGLIARRLTSNASSNPQIRALLREVDDVLKLSGKGVTEASTEAMQDFYNILKVYYPEIVGGTTFEGLSKSALQSSGITDFLVSGAKNLAGETPAVQRKALEKLLFDLLKV